MNEQEKQEKDNVNPATGKHERPVGFQPMTSATLRLEVPKRPGYHRHWFRGTPERIARAQRAGYTFVDQGDVDLNNFDLGGDAKQSGNTDLGSRVSVISGDALDASGQPGRLYLMECPLEFYEEGKKIINERNESVADALTSGMLGAGQGQTGETGRDAQQRYTKGGIPDLFNPNKRRRT